MFVKAFKNGRDVGIYQCTHIEVTDYSFASTLKGDDGQPLSGGRTGLDIQLCPLGITINLPADADKVFTTNDRGDAIHSYQWPPKVKPAPVAAGQRGY